MERTGVSKPCKVLDAKYYIYILHNTDAPPAAGRMRVAPGSHDIPVQVRNTLLVKKDLGPRCFISLLDSRKISRTYRSSSHSSA